MLPFVVGLVGAVALFALGIATGQPNWQVYLAVLVLGAGGVALLHRAVGLSPPTVWGLLLFGLGHLAGGWCRSLESIRVGGYDNTARDLVANLVGGVLVGGATAWEVRRADRAGTRYRSLG